MSRRLPFFAFANVRRRIAQTLSVALLSLIGVSGIAQSAQADYADAIAILRGGNGHQGDFRRAERLLRACAWQDNDALCQYSLGQLYETGLFPEVGSAYARHETDSIEALVWYYLAMLNFKINGESYAGGAELSNIAAKADEGCIALYEDFIGEGYGGYWRIWSVKERIVYILRSQGASGRYLLGLVRADAVGKKVTKAGGARNRCFNLIWIDHEYARMNFQAADAMGHPFAQQAILDLEVDMRKKGVNRVRPRAPSTRLTNFDTTFLYPPFSLNRASNEEALQRGNVPPRYLSDESIRLPEHEIELASLERLGGPVHQQLIASALGEIYRSGTKSKADFQKDLGLPKTQRLSSWEIVSALKLAANDGGKKSTNFLGEMYFQGLGVPKNLVISKHLFESAAFSGPAFDPPPGVKPHSTGHLEHVISLLGNDKPPPTDGISAAAVKNICLMMGNDKVFPASKLKARAYRDILQLMGPAYGRDHKACNALIL